MDYPNDMNDCDSLQISGAVNEYDWDRNFTWIELGLDQTISITEEFFEEFSLTKFLIDIGGSLGLWLGVGILQICLEGSSLLSIIKRLKQ